MLILKPNKSDLKKAAEILKSGGVIVYPTDTAYALGGSYNKKAVNKKILAIKKRTDPKFTLICSSLYQVEKFFKVSQEYSKLIKKYWPGPLSIVVSKKYAVRVPNNPIAIHLARQAGTPLIATSANISGQTTLYDSAEIVKIFKNKKNRPDAIIYCGKLPVKKTSTIVAFEKNQLKILRLGGVVIK